MAGSDGSDTYLFSADNDLVITFRNSTDSLQIIGQNSGSAQIKQVENFVFSNTTLTSEDVRALLITQQSTAGDDSITGFQYADTLQGGIGNDMLKGGDGSDTYIYNLGDEHDVIEEYRGDDVLQFGTGITAEHLSFSQINYNSDLLIEIAGGGSVLIQNQILHSNVIETIQFDGGSYNRTDILRVLVEQQSTPGDNIIIATSNADTLEGGTGNDTLEGDWGSDTYIYNLGDGNDVIDEVLGNNDILKFGAGITTEHLSFSRINDNRDLLIEIAGGGSVLVQNQTYLDNVIETIQFDGGNYTDWDIKQILINQSSTSGDDVIVGFYTEDTLNGGAGNDTLIGGQDADILTGGSGNDIFVFNYLYYSDSSFHNYDTITDFTQGEDKIDVSSHEFTGIQTGSPSDNTLGYTVINGKTIISDDSSFRLELIGEYLLTTNDFIFSAPIDVAPKAVSDSYELDEGKTLNITSINGVLANDTNADNYTLTASLVTNVTHGTLSLNADGSFSYTHDGSDNFTDSFTYKAHEGTEYGNTVTVTLTVHPAPTGQTITGTTSNNTLTGGNGNDTINGLAGSDSLYGGAGNDSLDAGIGNDRVFGEDGNDTLIGGGGYDTLDGGAGDDMLYGNDVNGTHLIGGIGTDTFIGGNGNDRITLDDEDHRVVHGNAGFDTITGSSFADSIYGGDGNDTIYGGAGDDLLYGDASRDVIYGEAGNDTIYGGTSYDLLEGGDGNDFIEGGDQHDTIYGGAGNDTLDGGNDYDVLHGGDGQDILTGGAGKDTLEGALGMDTLTGDTEQDIFLFTGLNHSTSASYDTITDFTQGQDKIDLASLGFTAIQAGTGAGTVLGYSIVEGNTVIESDGLDFAIHLAGSITLNDTDFIFGNS